MGLWLVNAILDGWVDGLSVGECHDAGNCQCLSEPANVLLDSHPLSPLFKSLIKIMGSHRSANWESTIHALANNNFNFTPSPEISIGGRAFFFTGVVDFSYVLRKLIHVYCRIVYLSFHWWLHFTHLYCLGRPARGTKGRK